MAILGRLYSYRLLVSHSQPRKTMVVFVPSELTAPRVNKGLFSNRVSSV